MGDSCSKIKLSSIETPNKEQLQIGIRKKHKGARKTAKLELEKKENPESKKIGQPANLNSESDYEDEKYDQMDNLDNSELKNTQNLKIEESKHKNRLPPLRKPSNHGLSLQIQNMNENSGSLVKAILKKQSFGAGTWQGPEESFMAQNSYLENNSHNSVIGNVSPIRNNENFSKFPDLRTNSIKNSQQLNDSGSFLNDTNSNTKLIFMDAKGSSFKDSSATKRAAGFSGKGKRQIQSGRGPNNRSRDLNNQTREMESNQNQSQVYSFDHGNLNSHLPSLHNIQRNSYHLEHQNQYYQDLSMSQNYSTKAIPKPFNPSIFHQNSIKPSSMNDRQTAGASYKTLPHHDSYQSTMSKIPKHEVPSHFNQSKPQGGQDTSSFHKIDSQTGLSARQLPPPSSSTPLGLPPGLRKAPQLCSMSHLDGIVTQGGLTTPQLAFSQDLPLGPALPPPELSEESFSKVSDPLQDLENLQMGHKTLEDKEIKYDKFLSGTEIQTETERSTKSFRRAEGKSCFAAAANQNKDKSTPDQQSSIQGLPDQSEGA